MFNFLLDGKIGDMLAPVVPTNKLFLAIQHHKNNEAHQLMLNTDVKKNSDSGYAAIHVACRYNNRVALDLLLSKGVEVNSVDKSGNTPLHYASKYGHADLCKYLVEQGGSVVSRNSKNQTAYDVADNHTVRQYLLPLQLHAERASGDYVPPDSSNQFKQMLYGNLSGGGPAYAGPPPTTAPPLAVVPPAAAGAGAGYAALPPQQYPPQQTMGAPPKNTSPPPQQQQQKEHQQQQSQQLLAQQQQPPLAGVSPGSSIPPLPPTAAVAGVPSQGFYTHKVAASSPNTRMIQPDGFHSSASDPKLQEKYGHIKEVKSIAPPPTAFSYSTDPSATQQQQQQQQPLPAASTGYNMFSAGAVAPNNAPNAGLYSRYVAYDPHTNSAVPPPFPPPPAAAPAATHYMTTTATTSDNTSAGIGAGGGGMSVVPPAGMPPLPPSQLPSASNGFGTNIAAPHSSGSGMANSTGSLSSNNSSRGSRLLGNKTLVGGDDLFASATDGGPSIAVHSTSNSSNTTTKAPTSSTGTASAATTVSGGDGVTNNTTSTGYGAGTGTVSSAPQSWQSASPTTAATVPGNVVVFDPTADSNDIITAESSSSSIL